MIWSYCTPDGHAVMHAMQPRHRSKCSARRRGQRRAVEELADQVDPPARRVHLLAPQRVSRAGGQAEPAVHAVLDQPRAHVAVLRQRHRRRHSSDPFGNRPGAIRWPGSNWSLTARISATRDGTRPNTPPAASAARTAAGAATTTTLPRGPLTDEPQRRTNPATSPASAGRPQVKHARPRRAANRRRHAPRRRAAASTASSTVASADTQNDTRISVPPSASAPAPPRRRLAGDRTGRAGPPPPARAATPSGDPSSEHADPDRPARGRPVKLHRGRDHRRVRRRCHRGRHSTGVRTAGTRRSRTPVPRAAGAAGTSPR